MARKAQRMVSDDQGMIALGVDSTDHKMKISWSPSQVEAVSSTSESVVIGGQVLLVAAPTGCQRRQLIESIDASAGVITENHYVVPLRQDMNEFTKQTSFLLDLLHDAGDGDVIILDVDVPYYSKTLDDSSCMDGDQLDPVSTWETCLKLLKRLVDDKTKTIGFVIVSATFDSRVIPRWLIDSAYTVMILDGVTSLAKASVLRNPDGERDLATDEDWIPGDPIRFQLECDGHWLTPCETISHPVKNDDLANGSEQPASNGVDNGLIASPVVDHETGNDESKAIVHENNDAEINEDGKSNLAHDQIPVEDNNDHKTIHRRLLAGKTMVGVMALAIALALFSACKRWL